MTDTVRFMLSGGIIIPPEKHLIKEAKLDFARQIVGKIVGLIAQLSPSSYVGGDDVDMAVISDMVVHFDLCALLKEPDHYERIKTNCQKIFNESANKKYFCYLTLYDWHSKKFDLIEPR